ncbi:membrane protein required for colicin V production [Peptoclostridium litorale DSM 5388]|uniref:Colicin V production protein n=1 Tax=Peptoclostridium litorale DSM 5388 TaxID=1121324 RepID=A0A069RH49_PEPLI|nr:CvpA family protein [Peptoclostridium litorale]KDR96369.1 hypothetical protein CLIT_4c02070 [Peptoclostridium litorale DSM 5388]SIO27105.1 membrane protein required for colicin V production [Peptoclostridium litorale DSM 5388]
MNYINSMNHVDAIIITVILFLGTMGYIKGFAFSLLNLAKYGISIACTAMYYEPISQTLMGNEKVMAFFMTISQSVFSGLENYEVIMYKASYLFAQAGAIILIFMACNIAIGIAVVIINGFLKIQPLSMVNKAAGFLFGSAKGTILVMLAFVIINPFVAMNPDGEIANNLNNSLLAKYFYMYNFMFKYFNGLIEIFNSNRLG